MIPILAKHIAIGYNVPVCMAFFERTKHFVRREPFFPYSRFIIPPSPTLEGYQMQLIQNNPAQVLPKRRFGKVQERIDRFREEQNGKGAWDAYKVNITSAHAAITYDEQGPQWVIQYTTAPTTYFQHRAGITKNTSYKEARMLSHSGNMPVAITGDQKIVLSTRPDHVNFYPRTITGTASGSWEGEPTRAIPTHANGATKYDELPPLTPPTPQNAVMQMLTEFHEETGVPRDLLTHPQTKITITGIAEDSQKRHWDILSMVELPELVTKDALQAFHKVAKKNNHDDTDPMAAHLIFIDATPEGVVKYLTQPNLFWDGTADRALLAVGKLLFMRREVANGTSQQEANQKATAWMDFVNGEVKKCRQYRDREVRKNRRTSIRQTKKKHRQAIAKEIRYWFNPFNRQSFKDAEKQRRETRARLRMLRSRRKGYDPHLTPEEQMPNSDVKQILQEVGYPVDQ